MQSAVVNPKPILHFLLLLFSLPGLCPRTLVNNNLTFDGKVDILDADSQQQNETSGSRSVIPCSNCVTRKRYEEESLDPVEFRLARIEVIKQQILRKLRLKAPPHLRVPKSVLPSVLSHGHVPVLSTVEEAHRSSTQTEADDFYGTTHNVVIFPENSTDSRRCLIRAPYPASCFTFRLSAEVMNRPVAAAELWIFKTSAADSDVNQTFVVSEILYDRGVLRKRILALEDTTMRSGWLRFAVGSAVSRWVAKPHVLHALEVSCKGCPRDSEYTEDAPVSLEERQQPFMVVTVGPSTPSRSRRSLDCTDGTTRCCRESFYLSFKEIGWDDWILQPQGYTANYCRGSCLTDVSISRYHHTTVLQRFIQSQQAKNEEPTLSLCCTPSRMSSISLIYLDDDGYIFQKSLPNMVVEACDCA